MWFWKSRRNLYGMFKHIVHIGGPHAGEDDAALDIHRQNCIGQSRILLLTYFNSSSNAGFKLASYV